MKLSKTVLRVIFALSFLVYLISCKENLNDSIQYDPNALRVAGNYKATTFMLPAINDASIDILAKGGMISVILTPSFKVSGRMLIPKIPSLPTEGADIIFEGEFAVKHDSLKFINFDNNNVLSHPQLYFVIKNRKLEGKLEAQTSTIVVLEKQD